MDQLQIVFNVLLEHIYLPLVHAQNAILIAQHVSKVLQTACHVYLHTVTINQREIYIFEKITLIECVFLLNI